MIHQTTCLTNTHFQHPNLDRGLSYDYCAYTTQPWLANPPSQMIQPHLLPRVPQWNHTRQEKKNLSQTQSHSSLLILTDVISHFQRKNKRGNIRTCSLTNLQTINWAQHAQHTAPIPMSYKYQLNRSWKQNTSTIHHCTAFPNQAHLYSDFRLNQDKRNTTVTHQISKAESNLASPKNGSKAPSLLHPFIPHKHESNSVQHIIQRQISCQTSKSALSIQKRFSLTPLTFLPRAIFSKDANTLNHQPWHLKIISNSNEKPDQGNKVFRLFHLNLLPVSIIMIEQNYKHILHHFRLMVQ